MSAYVIIGITFEDSEVLGVTLTEEDAEKFLEFYKAGITVAGFQEYDGYSIEVHSIIIFSDGKED